MLTELNIKVDDYETKNEEDAIISKLRDEFSIMAGKYLGY